MTDLFNLEKIEETFDPYSMSHTERVAWKKAGSIPFWEVCTWERIGETRDCLISGGIPRKLQSGKNKGQKTWKDSVITKVCVTGQEVDSEEILFTSETGKCARCLGYGKVLKSWSRDRGTEYRNCPKCTESPTV